LRNPRLVNKSGAVLWHTNLHLGNIFVSPDDPTTIKAIIDWQSSQVTPLFIQARFPDFLTPPKGNLSVILFVFYCVLGGCHHKEVPSCGHQTPAYLLLMTGAF
jgi:hypothetical protein